MLCQMDVRKHHLFDHFTVRYDWSLNALVQRAFDHCKVQSQHACVRKLALLLWQGDVAISSLLVLCEFPFYIWFSREGKGCDNYAAVVVVDNSLRRKGKVS